MLKDLRKYLFLLLMFISLPACAETLNSEIKNIRSENNFILIDVAKKYPKVQISQFHNPDKIFIELMEASLNKAFSFDSGSESTFLKGLNFAKGVTVGVARYLEGEEEKQKVSIILEVKEGSILKPKLKSTKDNIVSISLLQTDFNVVSSSANVVPEQESFKDLEIYNEAVEEQTKGNLDSAEKLYKEVLSENSNFYLAAFNLSKIYIDKKDYDQAIKLLSDLVEQVKKKSKSDQEKIDNLTYLLNTLGTVYYLINDLEKAEKVFNKLVENNFNLPETYFNLGLIFEKKKELDKAKKYFEDAIKLKPDYSSAYYHVAILDLIDKNKKKAIINFKKVVELDSGSQIADLSKKELEKIDKR